MVADLSNRFKVADKAAGTDKPTRKDCAHYTGWMGASLAFFVLAVAMTVLALAKWVGLL